MESIVVNNHRQGLLDVRLVRKSIDELLSRLDFNDLWPGFHKYTYALYDDERVYFDNKTLPKDDRFMGNTSINFEGEQIAIWYIGDESVKDVTLLAANLVHEMFHAYQMQSGELRFFNDL